MAEQLLLSLHGLLLSLQTCSPSPGHPLLPDPGSSRPFSLSPPQLHRPNFPLSMGAVGYVCTSSQAPQPGVPTSVASAFFPAGS